MVLHRPQVTLILWALCLSVFKQSTLIDKPVNPQKPEAVA